MFIYLFYRTEKTLVNSLAKKVLSEEQYFALREYFNDALPLTSPIVYSLPEGLWVFSITLTSQSFFLKVGKRYIPCILLPLVFAIGLEVLQLSGITKGRFDPVDIGVAILFWMMAYFFFGHDSKKQNLLGSVNLKSTFCLLSYCIVYLAHVLD